VSSTPAVVQRSQDETPYLDHGRTAAVHKRVTRSILSSLLLNIFANGFLYAGQLIIARSLTRNEYADYVVAINFVTLFALFADLGLTPMLTRMFSEAEERRAQGGEDRRGVLLGSALLLRTGLAAIVSGVILLASRWMGYSTDAIFLINITIVTLFISSRVTIVRSVGESLVRSQGKYQLAVFFAAIDALVFAGTLYYSYLHRLDVTRTGIIYAFCHLPGFILLTITVIRWARREHVKIRVDPKLLRMLLSVGVPLMFGTAFYTIHTTADPLFLKKLSTPLEVSAFGASVRFYAAVIFVPMVLSGILAPEVTRLLARGDGLQIRRLVDLAIRGLLVFAATTALFITCLSAPVVTLILGGKYADAAPLVMVIAWTFIPVCFATLLVEVAVASGKLWSSALYMGVVMIVTLTGDLLFVGPFGALGATLTKTAAVLLASLVLVRKLGSFDAFDLRWFARFLWRFLLAILLAIGSYFALREIRASDISTTIATLFVFLLAIALLRAIRVDEIRKVITRGLVGVEEGS
jgi:O-antigen/teichoic acid export membrane protein